jgi:hypothetical protein
MMGERYHKSVISLKEFVTHLKHSSRASRNEPWSAIRINGEIG